MPPTLEGEDEMVLSADRGTRFWARLWDNILFGIACVPAILALVNDARFALFVLGLLPLALLCYQWALISTHGQTLGKMWMGIEVTRLDGSPVGFLRGVLLRDWARAAVFCPSVGGLRPHSGILPGLALLAWLVDVLMIFGTKRRCLHDLIGGTKVVLTSGTL
jgi:uncharacterized RDD family membrane protein YckC